MLQSSLGFHTMTLYMSLSMHNAQQLIMDFNTYRKNTGLIEMYRINERNKIVKYYPNPDKPEKILQFLHISSTIKKNVGGCVHVTYR